MNRLPIELQILILNKILESYQISFQNDIYSTDAWSLFRNQDEIKQLILEISLKLNEQSIIRVDGWQFTHRNIRNVTIFYHEVRYPINLYQEFIQQFITRLRGRIFFQSKSGIEYYCL